LRKATEADLDLVVDVCVHSLNRAIGVNWLFKNKVNTKKLSHLATFAFYKCLQSDGVLISDNGKAVLMYFQNKIKDNFRTKFFQGIFVLSSIPFFHLPKVLYREKTRAKIRPSAKHIYVFLFAAKKDSNRAGFELQKAFDAEIKQLNLTAYVETAMERNKNAYERYGYETYDYWKDEDKGIEFWFMKKEPLK